MSEKKILTEIQYGALKEVGNVGIGNATTSLSKMVNKRVDISLPDLKLIPLIEVPQMVRYEEPVVGIVLELKGDAKGFLLLLLSKDDAKLLIKLIAGIAEGTDTFDEMEESVLKELGNIMTGTYITALSKFLDLSLGLSPPSQVYDMADAIINQIVSLMGQDTNDVLFLKTEFSVNSEKLGGNVLIFTDSLSTSKILEAINRIAGL